MDGYKITTDEENLNVSDYSIGTVESKGVLARLKDDYRSGRDKRCLDSIVEV